MLDNISPGPNREKIIKSALRERLLRDHVLDPAKIEDMLTVAVQNVRVRVTLTGWAVTESDAARFMSDARSRPGWLRAASDSESTPNESAYDRLRRANAETKQEPTQTAPNAEDSETRPHGSAMDKLKRANRESRPLKQNLDGSWSPRE